MLAVTVSAAAFGCGGDEPGDAPGREGPGGSDADATPSGEEPDGGAEQPVRLSIRVRDGGGASRAAEVTCGQGPPRATGYLSGAAEEVCREARRLGSFLADEPDADRICTQVYGGPETASIEGRVGGTRIDRRLGRANGCEIAAWDRAEALLEPVRAR